MPFDPAKPPVSVPRFSSPVSSLSTALNLLGDAIKSVEARIPDVRLNIKGDTEWNGKQTIIRPRGRPEDTLPPFWPVLLQEGSEYRVVVTKGCVVVIDRCAGVGENAISDYLDPENRLDGDNYRIFNIAVGEAVYILVREDSSGMVSEVGDDPAVEIVIAQDDKRSTNYYPIKSATDQRGEYYYKLAVLIEDETGAVRFERWLAGSNIYHHCGLTADLYVEDCYGIGEGENGTDLPGNMIFRLSFLSGILVKMNKTLDERPLAEYSSRHRLTPCDCIVE